MTITDAVSRSLASLVEGNCPSATRVDSGISADINTAFDQRVMVIGNSASLRHPFVTGIYDVMVTIAVQQSADTTDAVTLFRTLCEEVRSLLSLKDDLPSMMTAELPELKVHSVLSSEQSANPSERGLQALFGVQVFAELPT